MKNNVYTAAADGKSLIISGEMELAGDSRPVLVVVEIDTTAPAFRAEMAKLNWRVPGSEFPMEGRANG